MQTHRKMAALHKGQMLRRRKPISNPQTQHPVFCGNWGLAGPNFVHPEDSRGSNRKKFFDFPQVGNLVNKLPPLQAASSEGKLTLKLILSILNGSLPNACCSLIEIVATSQNHKLVQECIQFRAEHRRTLSNVVSL